MFLQQVFFLVLIRKYAALHLSGNGYELPDIVWDPVNPIFNDKTCGASSRRFSLKFNDDLSILCGNMKINNAVKSNTKAKDPSRYYFNIYRTTNIDSYINADSTDAKLIHVCRQKYMLRKSGNVDVIIQKKELFNYKSAFSGVYKEGGTYYFFTTSDGTKSSINNTIGAQATRHMRFEVYICRQQEACEGRARVNTCLKPKNSKIIASDDSSSLLSEPQFVLSIIGALIAGLAMGIMGMLLMHKCQHTGKSRDSDVNLTLCSKSSSPNYSNEDCEKEMFKCSSNDMVHANLDV